MSATHIIIGGVVVNTIVATIEEAQTAYPDAVCIPADTGGIGWLWDGENLTPPSGPPFDRAAAALHIDEAVAAIYGRFTRFDYLALVEEMRTVRSFVLKAAGM